MKKVVIIIFSLLPCLLVAQKLDMKLFKELTPRSIGPGGMSGRVTAIDVVNNQPEIIYVGTASGGIWKSTSAGINWVPVFDKESTLSIGAIAIQQSNPSVIWVGTGEGNPRNSLNGGNGVFRSLDAGKTWSKMGLSETRNIHRIIIDPTNPNVVYVSAIGSPWGFHPERGVFKTSDAGKTWRKILYTNESSGAADLIMDPSNPNKLVAAMWEHHRDPWFFKSGGAGSGLYVTFDGGESWAKRDDKDGLPKGEIGRIGLAIAPSNSNIIFALVESKKNALYKSIDGGFKWEKINDKGDIGDRPFYYSDIRVDPKNENRVYSVFTSVNVSEDGGLNFNQLMPSYGVSNGVHPDHHAWWIHPEDPDFMMDGNDGGLNISRDRGNSWYFVQNIPVAQFYHIAVDNEFPYNVYGGMQDNGSWAGPAYNWRVQGIRNSYWQEISFGDGFDVLPDPDNSRFGISASQQGSAVIYDRLTGSNESIRPTYPDMDIELRFNWNAAMNRDPFDPKIIYFGSQFVHKSIDAGQTWNLISDDLTTNDPNHQKQGDSGGLTMDATGAENYCTILVIEPSPIQKDLLWVGTDDGQVNISKDGGKTWDNVSKNVGFPEGAWITQIKASSYNKNEAFLVANDYRRFNEKPMVFRTLDYGQTWESIVDENEEMGYSLSIVQDPIEPNLIFLGASDGLYVSIDGSGNWTKWTEGMPNVNVMDMVIHPRESDLVIATFGRAAYVLDDISPLRAVAAKPTLLDRKVNLFTPPDAYLVTKQQPTGSRFGADGMFHGENRSANARISYYVQIPAEKGTAKESPSTDSKKKSKKEANSTIASIEVDTIKYDTITFDIYHQDELIRTIAIKQPEESGFHKIEWGLDEKGPNRISRSSSSNSTRRQRERGGVDVLPGNYLIKMTYGNQQDSTNIRVSYDPRIALSENDLRLKQESLKALERSADRLSIGVDRIKESLALVSQFEKGLKDMDKELYKEEIKMCKTTKDSLTVLMDIVFGKEDDRQGITKNPFNTLYGHYNNAYRYTANGLHTPGLTEQKLTAKFEVALQQALDRINNFYESEWPKFRIAIEPIEINKFKEYSKIE
ncbi:MAG: hypothetical protein HQ474_11645 [Flammeovirgaceae bacterium]|jgi:photosystem II stability/assembly factor-like uncharacterized protein|nr:hypothetical protein [Flammeovirgaceae bacterium]